MILSPILVLSLPTVLLLAAAKNEPAAGAKNDEAIRRDVTLPSLSLYLPIPLGVPRIETQATGVFIPANYRVGPMIDLVLFLRGYDIKSR